MPRAVGDALRFAVCLLSLAGWSQAAPSAPSAGASVALKESERAAEDGLPEAITPTDWLVLPRVGDYRRAAFHADPVEVAVARGDWGAPKAGDEVTRPSGGAAVWRSGASDRAYDLVGGYAYAEFDSPAAGVMLVDVAGCAAVCVNGSWLPGDPYGVGWFRLPVAVDQGANWVLVHLARPDAKPRLLRPESTIDLIPASATLPDLVAGDSSDGKKRQRWASVTLRNSGDKALEGAALRVAWVGEKAVVEPLRRIESRLLTPVSFQLPQLPDGVSGDGAAALRVEVVDAESEESIAACELSVRVASPDSERMATYRSAVDGSIQPYAVRLASPGGGPAAVALLLHDAGETPAQCLARNPAIDEIHFVAPGGRGAWGFDWEDWSRLDALDALDNFLKDAGRRGIPVDRDRIAVVGRGMGGHGALRLATLHPDRVASAGLTDGWISFYTQGGALATPADAEPLTRVLGRQASANDPLRALKNLSSSRVSVLLTSRGVASESRYLRERLGEFHPDLTYRELPEGDAAKAAIGEQLRHLASKRRSDPKRGDALDFATPSVGAASTCGWLTIELASRQGDTASAQINRDLVAREVVGTTSNVRRLRLDLSDFAGDDEADPVIVRLDGRPSIKVLPGREGVSVSLARGADKVWRRVPNGVGGGRRFAPPFRSPTRAGGFKSAFRHEPRLVYGTRGSEEERRWAADKARYDAHQFLYRGAGRLEVISDTAYAEAFRSALSAGRRETDRSIVLYGNEQTNSAWRLAWAPRRRDNAVRVEPGAVQIGPRPESGEDLAVLAIRPRPFSSRSTIGVIGGAGPVGMRLTTRLRYFWSGVSYPDVLLFGPDALDPKPGERPAADVRAAGYFDVDWDAESDQIIWRDLAI